MNSADLRFSSLLKAIRRVSSGRGFQLHRNGALKELLETLGSSRRQPVPFREMTERLSTTVRLELHFLLLISGS
jgi:hypothetical protein